MIQSMPPAGRQPREIVVPGLDNVVLKKPVVEGDTPREALQSVEEAVLHNKQVERQLDDYVSTAQDQLNDLTSLKTLSQQQTDALKPKLAQLQANFKKALDLRHWSVFGAVVGATVAISNGIPAPLAIGMGVAVVAATHYRVHKAGKALDQASGSNRAAVSGWNGARVESIRVKRRLDGANESLEQARQLNKEAEGPLVTLKMATADERMKEAGGVAVEEQHVTIGGVKIPRKTA